MIKPSEGAERPSEALIGRQRVTYGAFTNTRLIVLTRESDALRLREMYAQYRKTAFTQLQREMFVPRVRNHPQICCRTKQGPPPQWTVNERFQRGTKGGSIDRARRMHAGRSLRRYCVKCQQQDRAVPEVSPINRYGSTVAKFITVHPRKKVV